MNGESRGFAFLKFAYASCAASAMVNMGGAVLHGPFGDNVLKVGPSTRETQAQVCCSPAYVVVRVPLQGSQQTYSPAFCVL